MPSRYSCFAKFAKCLRKGTIVCAKARAPLCSDKNTFVPPRSAMVHKSDTTRKPEAQISIFQRYESQTSHLDFTNYAKYKCGAVYKIRK